MNSNNLNIELEFDLSVNPDVFNVTDTTNYASSTYSNILGNLKAISPSGTTIHNNTSYVSPDINYGSSTTSANFSLPSVTSGTYVFTYTIKMEDELTSYRIVSNDIAGKTITVAGNYATVINDGTATAFNCVDVVNTALTGVSATYSSTTGNTTITILQTLPLLTVNALFQFTVDAIYSKVFSQAYTYISPDVCLSWEQDECCSSMTITDVSVYDGDATVTRLHTLSYPDGMVIPIADIVSPLQLLTVTPIWTGTWTDVFTADILTSNGIINITDAVRGVKEFKVSSDTYSCQIYSCYKNIVNKYADQLVTAPALAVKTGAWLLKATGVLNAYNLGKKCGETDYTDFLTQITTIATTCGCSCDCADCSNDTPTQIVGCCDNVGQSNFTVVVRNLDGSITVNASTVGSTTTFTISVDAAWFNTTFLSKINTTSIDELSDVNLSIPPVVGKALVWQGSYWAAQDPSIKLVNLQDVDNTGLANTMIMYWDSGSSSFKFQLNTVTNLSDTTFTGLANLDIMQWNGSAWVNVDNFLSLLTDVNTTGIINDSALKWDTGTNKFIVYQPKTTLESLNDVVFPVAPAVNDTLVFNSTGTTQWENVPRASFVVQANGTFNAGVFDNQVVGYYQVAIRRDLITGAVQIRGVADNLGGALGVQTTIFTMADSSLWPTSEVPFIVTGGINSTPTVVGGSISTAGVVSIAWYINPANGVRTAGLPAGDIDLGQIPTWYV